MRLIIMILLLIILLAVWLFPVIIAFVTGNFWLILLYVVWWIPAVIITSIFGAIIKNL